MKLSNPPAFPSATSPSPYGAWGMTLRDYFAAAALGAVVAHIEKALNSDGENLDFDPSGVGAQLVAEDCYTIADAMLAARNKASLGSKNDVLDMDSRVLKVLASSRYNGLATGRSLAACFRNEGRSFAALLALKTLTAEGKVLIVWHPKKMEKLLYATPERASDLLADGWVKE